jgi:hypothetical protein
MNSTLAHADAVDHRVAGADFHLVVELDAGGFQRGQGGQGKRQQECGKQLLHGLSPR